MQRCQHIDVARIRPNVLVMVLVLWLDLGANVRLSLDDCRHLPHAGEGQGNEKLRTLSHHRGELQWVSDHRPPVLVAVHNNGHHDSHGARRGVQ